jgi:hypothetical protein
MKGARFLRGVASRATLALCFGVVALALTAPAGAQDYGHGPPGQDYGRGPPPHEEHDRDRDHHERFERRYYPPPPPETVYAPPPVLYAPPAPPPGLSIIIPFNFR